MRLIQSYGIFRTAKAKRRYKGLELYIFNIKKVILLKLAIGCVPILFPNMHAGCSVAGHMPTTYILKSAKLRT
jgi:hypothetical protein